MKKGLHPENYREVVFKDMSNEEIFITRSTVATKETIEVDGVTYSDISGEIKEESSQEIKKRVDFARKIQTNRFENQKIYSNSKMTNAMIKKYCKLDEESNKMLQLAFDNLKLTARAYNRILKVARTIADLDGCEQIKQEHIFEAINYRSLDDKYWI
jgi:magnesium chelatase family protein